MHLNETIQVFEKPAPKPSVVVAPVVTPGRNEPCSCGSKKKYKKCCLNNPKQILTIPMNTNPDQIGLPQEHVKYAKPNCKDCYGKGVMTRIAKPNTLSSTCPCVHKGYSRTRVALERRVDELVAFEAGFYNDIDREEVKKRITATNVGLFVASLDK